VHELDRFVSDPERFRGEAPKEEGSVASIYSSMSREMYKFMAEVYEIIGPVIDRRVQ
jgi:hypothetical protein